MSDENDAPWEAYQDTSTAVAEETDGPWTSFQSSEPESDSPWLAYQPAQPEQQVQQVNSLAPQVDMSQLVGATPSTQVEFGTPGDAQLYHPPMEAPPDYMDPEKVAAQEQALSRGLLTRAGVGAENMPTGQELMTATGAHPSIAYPLSAVSKTVTGVADWMTSPVGFPQLVAASIPGVNLIMGAKFAKDMIEGGYVSAKDVGVGLAEGDWQKVSEGVSNFAANVLGVKAVVGHGIKNVKASGEKFGEFLQGTGPAFKPGAEPIRFSEPTERSSIPDTVQPSEAAPAPPSASSTPTPPATASAGGVSSKPEVAEMAEARAAQLPNKFGDPPGTKYHATVEDWAEWKRVGEMPSMKDGDFNLDKRKAKEAVRNKYGGMDPQPPKVAPESSKSPVQQLEDISKMTTEELKAIGKLQNVGDALGEQLKTPGEIAQVQSLLDKLADERVGLTRLQEEAPAGPRKDALLKQGFALDAKINGIGGALDRAAGRDQLNPVAGEQAMQKAKAALEKQPDPAAPTEPTTVKEAQDRWREKYVQPLERMFSGKGVHFTLNLFDMDWNLKEMSDRTGKLAGDHSMAQRMAEFVGPEAAALYRTMQGNSYPYSLKTKPPAAETTAETQGAIASSVAPLQPATAAPVQLTPKSQRQIITDLAKGLKVPIRFGRLTTNKFAGYFKSVANLIGSKKANQIPLVSHEVGHKLDSTFKLSGEPSIAAELNVLGDPATPGSYSSWTKSKTNKYKMGEGVAEFTRLWLTDPAKALTDAPNTHKAFVAALDANKDFGDTMRQAQEDIRVWRTAEPQARLRSHISIGSNPNKTSYTASQLTRDLIDDLHFARLAVDDARKLSGRTLDPSENFYLLARNLRGSYGMADTFIRDGVTDFKTKSVKLGTGLEDALKPVAGRISDFRDWIVSKQAQELHRAGKQTGLVDADVNTVAAKFDADPAFQEAFTKVKAWNDAMLQYAVDSGLITPDSAAFMRKMNQDYVPLHRVFEVGAGEAPSVESGGTGRGLNVGKPASLMGRHGSPRDIVDPLETMVRNAYAVITASEKSAINLAVADLSRSPGMGKWIERVAAPKQNIKVGLDNIRKQLEDAGADLTGVPDDLLVSFFQNSGKAPFGENIIKVVRDGQPEFYRLNRDLFDTFHALDLEDSGKLVRILSSPAQLLRSGVTLAPDFALANALRDTFSAAILSKYNAYPFEVTLRGLGAMISNPKLVAEWAAAGGKNSIEANYFDRAKLQSFLKEKISKDLTPAEQALVMAKSPLTALRWMTSISEEATRVGEYQKALNSLVKSGMPEGEARRLAAFESRDRQDFAKGGAKTKIVRHMAAFWNAQLQANVRLAQAFKERPLQTIGKGLLYITTAKLLEQAVNYDDKDYWDRPQWERDLFFLIPIGQGKDGHTKFIRIPTPFEPGVIFGTLPGRVIQWAKENDPNAMAGFPSLMLKQTVPNPIPQTLQTVFADFLSGKKGWDVWRGRQVVPESLANKPPEDQWTEQTSLTARHLGKLLGFSPIKIDHIISSSTGGVGKTLTHQVSDRTIGAVTGEKPTARGKVPGGRFVTTPAAVSSRSRDDFYETLEALRVEKQRQKDGGKPQLNVNRWGATFERKADELSKIRKQMLATKDEAVRQRLAERQLQIVRDTMKRYKESP